MEDNNSLDMLDILNILSFVIGLMNYRENLTQGDKQDLMSEVDNTTKETINIIKEHLAEQDEKLDLILNRLEELK